MDPSVIRQAVFGTATCRPTRTGQSHRSSPRRRSPSRVSARRLSSTPNVPLAAILSAAGDRYCARARGLPATGVALFFPTTSTPIEPLPKLTIRALSPLPPGVLSPAAPGYPLYRFRFEFLVGAGEHLDIQLNTVSVGTSVQSHDSEWSRRRVTRSRLSIDN